MICFKKVKILTGSEDTRIRFRIPTMKALRKAKGQVPVEVLGGSPQISTEDWLEPMPSRFRKRWCIPMVCYGGDITFNGTKVSESEDFELEKNSNFATKYVRTCASNLDHN